MKRDRDAPEGEGVDKRSRSLSAAAAEEKDARIALALEVPSTELFRPSRAFRADMEVKEGATKLERVVFQPGDRIFTKHWRVAIQPEERLRLYPSMFQTYIHATILCRQGHPHIARLWRSEVHESSSEYQVAEMWAGEPVISSEWLLQASDADRLLYLVQLLRGWKQCFRFGLNYPSKGECFVQVPQQQKDQPVLVQLDPRLISRGQTPYSLVGVSLLAPVFAAFFPDVAMTRSAERAVHKMLWSTPEAFPQLAQEAKTAVFGEDTKWTEMQARIWDMVKSFSPGIPTIANLLGHPLLAEATAIIDQWYPEPSQESKAILGVYEVQEAGFKLPPPDPMLGGLLSLATRLRQLGEGGQWLAAFPVALTPSPVMERWNVAQPLTHFWAFWEETVTRSFRGGGLDNLNSWFWAAWNFRVWFRLMDIRRIQPRQKSLQVYEAAWVFLSLLHTFPVNFFQVMTQSGIGSREEILGAAVEVLHHMCTRENDWLTLWSPLQWLAVKAQRGVHVDAHSYHELEMIVFAIAGSGDEEFLDLPPDQMLASVQKLLIFLQSPDPVPETARALARWRRTLSFLFRPMQQRLQWAKRKEGMDGTFPPPIITARNFQQAAGATYDFKATGWGPGPNLRHKNLALLFHVPLWVYSKAELSKEEVQVVAAALPAGNVAEDGDDDLLLQKQMEHVSISDESGCCLM